MTQKTVNTRPLSLRMLVMRFRSVMIGSLLIMTALLAGQSAAAETRPYYGSLQSGGFLWVETPEGTELRWRGNEVETHQPRTLIGLGRDESGNFELWRRLADGTEKEWTVEVASRSYREQRVQGVPPETVDPSPEQIARMEREAEKTRSARGSQTPGNTGVTMPFAWPLEGRITGVYGSRRWYNGDPGTPHWGIDIAAAEGTPVRAPADGLVTLADDLFLSGGTIFLDHGQQLTSAFLHLSELKVEPEQWVRQGDIIGLVGATGRATGPHLDWRMDLAGKRIDPTLWTQPMDELCTIRGDGEELVILLHGLGRTALSMEDLAIALRDEGYSTCNQNYPSRELSIQELAAYVANAVQKGRVAEKSRIHFVTHSMGGIILRYYLGYSSHSEPGHVVMLAPPNQGSEVIDALNELPGFGELMGPAALQLSTASDSLPNSLPPIDLPVGVLAGTRSSDPWFDDLFDDEYDGKVSVESTRLLTMTDHKVMPVSHTFIMHNRDVHAEVFEFLRHGRFREE